MKPSNFLLLLAAFVILVSTIVISIPKKTTDLPMVQQVTPSPQLMTPTPLPSPSSQMKTYHSQKCRFSFSYPSNWYVFEKDFPNTPDYCHTVIRVNSENESYFDSGRSGGFELAIFFTKNDQSANIQDKTWKEHIINIGRKKAIRRYDFIGDDGYFSEIVVQLKSNLFLNIIQLQNQNPDLFEKIYESFRFY